MGATTEYANFWGIVHAGVLTVAALDELAATAAWLAFRRRGVQQPFVVSAEYTVGFALAARIVASLIWPARVAAASAARARAR